MSIQRNTWVDHIRAYLIGEVSWEIEELLNSLKPSLPAICLSFVAVFPLTRPTLLITTCS